MLCLQCVQQTFWQEKKTDYLSQPTVMNTHFLGTYLVGIYHT